MLPYRAFNPSLLAKRSSALSYRCAFGRTEPVGKLGKRRGSYPSMLTPRRIDELGQPAVTVQSLQHPARAADQLPVSGSASERPRDQTKPVRRKAGCRSTRHDWCSAPNSWSKSDKATSSRIVFRRLRNPLTVLLALSRSFSRLDARALPGIFR